MAWAEEAEVEWVAEVWDPVENAGALIAAIPCHIKLECHAISRHAPNAGLK